MTSGQEKALAKLPGFLTTQDEGPTSQEVDALRSALAELPIVPTPQMLGKLPQYLQRQYLHMVDVEDVPAAQAWRTVAASWRLGSREAKTAGRVTSVTATMRLILNGRVPTKLRQLIATRLGVTLSQVDQMPLREVIASWLVFDYLEKGRGDAVLQLLDRVDPKSRRVEHTGTIQHDLRALQANTTEADAADAYKAMLGSGAIIDVEPEE